MFTTIQRFEPATPGQKETYIQALRDVQPPHGHVEVIRISPAPDGSAWMVSDGVASAGDTLDQLFAGFDDGDDACCVDVGHAPIGWVETLPEI